MREKDVNLNRYVIAGGLSLAFHALLLITTDEAQVFAMPAGNPTQSVSINMVSMPKVTPAQPEQTQTEQSKPESVKPTPVQEAVKTPPAKPKVEPHKPKPQTVKKPVPAEQVPSKSVAKPQAEKVERTAETAQKPAPTPNQQPSQPTAASQGITSQPILVDKPALVSAQVQPRYPRIARKRGIEGTVMYEIWLDAQGNQIKQQLLSSSGTEALDQSALEAIKQWKFSPHILDGVPVAHRIHIPIRFKLEG
ncbi:TonB family protein [Vibrio cholerae]|nr:TonB family protein [Vibrio cholerae]MEB5528742.1 TonB family protein [Vibrio cholerae]PUA71797.1 energy transducer TonB [Vibrio cholerae]TVM57945.1 energy transducer TonB [Vibrio cholerae]TVN07203.1 energy transducer TonB [Vibrio cholerae]